QLQTHGLSGLIGYVVVACIGQMLCWTGFCLTTGVAFEESALQGICCIFVPFYVLIYAGRNCQPYLAPLGIGLLLAVGVRFAVPNVEPPANNQFAQQPMEPTPQPFVQPAPVTPSPRSNFNASRGAQ